MREVMTDNARELCMGGLCGREGIKPSRFSMGEGVLHGSLRSQQDTDEGVELNLFKVRHETEPDLAHLRVFVGVDDSSNNRLGSSVAERPACMG